MRELSGRQRWVRLADSRISVSKWRAKAAMQTHMVLLSLIFVMLPTASLAQVPRDPPPPSIQNARRERQLRAVVASGGATRNTYLELVNVELALSRFEEAAAALRGAADLEPTVPEVQYMLGTMAWLHASRDLTEAAGRLAFIREGIALEDRALTLKPDYTDAMTYKNILLRMLASLTTDAADKVELIAEADRLRSRVMEITRQESPQNAPASFSGFGESFEETLARLTPVRVGGAVRQATKTHNVYPSYPIQAATNHVQGVVIIEAIIDASGSVANARILRSIAPLDEAALSAVSRWQFTPTVVNGAPVALLMTVTVNFTLHDGR